MKLCKDCKHYDPMEGYCAHNWTEPEGGTIWAGRTALQARCCEWACGAAGRGYVARGPLPDLPTPAEVLEMRGKHPRRMKANQSLPRDMLGATHTIVHDENPWCAAPPACQPLGAKPPRPDPGEESCRTCEYYEREGEESPCKECAEMEASQYRRRPDLVAQGCHWTENEDGAYDTSCGNIFELSNLSTPAENGMRFCCYCGGALTPNRLAWKRKGKK